VQTATQMTLMSSNWRWQRQKQVDGRRRLSSREFDGVGWNNCGSWQRGTALTSLTWFSWKLPPTMIER